MTEKTNVPEIRFAGFTDPWEQRKLGDCFDFLKNNTLSRADLNGENGIARNVHYGDILIKFGDCLDGEQSDLPFITDDTVLPKFAGSILSEGDVIFADTAEDEAAGKCIELRKLPKEPTISGLHTIPARPRFPFGTGYLGHYLNSDAYHRQLLPLMQGIKVISVSKAALQDTQVRFPSLSEQSAIGVVLSEIDALITLHQRKHDKLVQLKKSMLDKMFPKPGETEPEIRFAGFTDPWEQRKLGDICERHKEMVPTPKDGYVRMGVRSHAKGTFLTMVKPGAEIEEKELSRVKAHCLVVNIVFAWEQAIAITSTEDEKALVSHRFPQFLFHDDMHPDYFRYAILNDSFERHLWLASPSGAGRNKTLNVGTMLEYSFTLPNKKEQEAIASCLTRLDSLITLHQREPQFTDMGYMRVERALITMSMSLFSSS